MQQLLEELKHYQATFQNPIGPIIEKIENELIEKERRAIVSAFAWGNITKVQYKSQHIAGEDYYNDRYNETFNTEEKWTNANALLQLSPQKLARTEYTHTAQSVRKK